MEQEPPHPHPTVKADKRGALHYAPSQAPHEQQKAVQQLYRRMLRQMFPSLSMLGW